MSEEAGAVTEPSQHPRRKVSYLTTAEFARLNHACLPVREAFGFGTCYLVGSSSERDDYRDVDVRVILADDEFDRLFGHAGSLFWSLFCLGMTEYLCKVTGLPIDFQVQRRTEANEKFGGRARNPIGTKGRPFAGGGDATRFSAEAEGDHTEPSQHPTPEDGIHACRHCLWDIRFDGKRWELAWKDAHSDLDDDCDHVPFPTPEDER